MCQSVMPDCCTLGYKTKCWSKLLEQISGNARDCFPTFYNICRFIHDRLFDEQIIDGGPTLIVIPFVEYPLQIRSKDVVKIDFLLCHPHSILDLPAFKRT